MKHYCVFIKFNGPKELHLVHNDIKAQNFILSKTFTSIVEAKKASIKYINRFFDNNYDSWNHLPEKIPITPESLIEWEEFDYGYICTDDPQMWRLSMWNKIQTKGIIFNSFEIVKIFDVDILEVYEEPESDDEEGPLFFDEWIEPSV